MNTVPSVEQLKRALELAEKIASLQSELDSLWGKAPVKAGKKRAAASAEKEEAPAGKAKRAYNMSPEARERIAAAQRRRWAKAKRAAKKAAAAASEEA